MDLKYGNIEGTGRFFFQLSIIDVWDRTVVGYHIGLSATAKDAARVLANALKKRGLKPGDQMPVIRTDNGPQFIAEAFQSACESHGIVHERIPVKSPSLNAYIESFHSLLEDECYNRYEFQSFEDVYRYVGDYIDYYNYRRKHGSINKMAPIQFYRASLEKQVSVTLLVA